MDDVSLSSVEKDKRFNTYGIPRNKSKAKKADKGKETVPNANYLWINLFATSLKPKGRAALVMANSASDARHSEAEIRKTLIEKNLIYAMVTLPSNMFYTVTLPARFGSSTRARPTTVSSSLTPGTSLPRLTVPTANSPTNRSRISPSSANFTKVDRQKFVQLIDRYFAAGMERLIENKTRVEPVSAQLLEVLDDDAGKHAVAELVKQWAGLNKLQPATSNTARNTPAKRRWTTRTKPSSSCAKPSILSLPHCTRA